MQVGDNAELTAEQRDAIDSDHQFVNVIAGPGTGKTYCLGHRIARKIRNGADPKRILAASFTNEACAALRNQLYSLIGEAAKDIEIFTFHSFCRHLIERERQITSPGAPALAIADDWDSQAFLKGLGKDLTLKKVRSTEISELNQLDAFNKYLRLMEKHNMVDFRSLLIMARDLAKQAALEYDHLFVDEFQDTSMDQFTILEQMVAGNPALNVTVVGDPNQAIYGFNEADFSPFDEFDKLCTTRTFHLRGNFRSTKQLVDFTNTKMPIMNAQVSTRLESMERPRLVLPCADATMVDFSEVDAHLLREIQRVRKRFGSVTVLVYTNKIIAHIIELLKGAGIPYEYGFNKAMLEHKDSRFVYRLFRYVTTRREIQLISLLDQSNLLSTAARRQLEGLTEEFTLPIADAIPQLKRIKNQQILQKFCKLLESVVEKLDTTTDPEVVHRSVRRLLKEVPGATYLSNSFVERLIDTMQVQSLYSGDDMPIVHQFMSNHLPLLSDTTQQSSVHVRTIHSSKGLEWPAVIMPYMGTLDSWRFYKPQSNDPTYRKALYVGMTRARDSLSILASGFTPLKFNPTISLDGKLGEFTRTHRAHLFPKLYSPLVYRKVALGPLSLSRGMHYLLRII